MITVRFSGNSLEILHDSNVVETVSPSGDIEELKALSNTLYIANQAVSLFIGTILEKEEKIARTFKTISQVQ